MHSWEELGATSSSTNGCSVPKDQENKMDKFLSVCGLIYVIVNSCKNKGYTLKEYNLKEVIPYLKDV